MDNAVKIKRVTLKAVAQAAGVSLPTASQILNNKANNYCSSEKKRLVHRVAKELNYQPNFGYKVMCGQQTNTIGLICSRTEFLREEHIKDLLLTLMMKFEKQGHSVYTSAMSDSAKENVSKITSLINRGCSGFVLLGTPFGGHEIENIFIQNNIPYVFYSTYSFNRKIVIDTPYAIKCFIERFIEEDRSNFKFVTNININNAYSRIQGLFNAFPDISQDQLIKKYVVSIDSVAFDDIEGAFQAGYEITEKLIESSPDIRGILYRNDCFALGGAKYLSEKGYKIGEDIKLCGYNNSEAVRLAPWPINTADHDIETLCRVISEQLLKKDSFEIIVKPKVILK